jgi:trehalose/maltose transport system substrate-binding protein
MSFVRSGRRALIAATSLSALLVVAACGGGGSSSGSGSSAPAASDFTKQGDIEYWQGKDTSGFATKLVDAFNAQHPNGKVTLHELSAKADEQQQQMIQNTQIKNPKMGVLSMDVVWTGQFAANGYVEAMPADTPTTGMLKAPVDAATYFGKLYGLPASSDGGLLFYRTDLMKKYDIAKPPTTFDEMKADCDKIIAGENNKKLSCFAGQYNKYEGLTVNFDEAVHGAGGVIVGDDGKPNVATPEAAKGLQTLTDWFKEGLIPKAAITWTEEEGRTAFEHGELIFHRNWGYVYAKATNDSDSVIKGKFDTAPLPGITGPGVSSLGGHTMAIAKNADNKGTALDFMKFATTPAMQKQAAIVASQTPVLEATYSDPEVLKTFPFFKTELASVQGAKPRPKAVQYADVSLAIQDAAYGNLQAGANGQSADPTAALQGLQTKLQTLIK